VIDEKSSKLILNSKLKLLLPAPPSTVLEAPKARLLAKSKKNRNLNRREIVVIYLTKAGVLNNDEKLARTGFLYNHMTSIATCALLNS